MTRRRPRRPARSSAAACSGSRPPTPWCQLGLETHVVEMAPRLMPVQLDEAGGGTLVRHIEKLGVEVHCGAATQQVVERDGHGRRARARRPRRSTPRSSCSPRASGPATSSPGPAGSRSPSAAASLVDEHCRTERPARVRDRRVRRPGRADVRPGRPRLRDGRGRRRPPARRRGVVHRRRHVHQAQAARRRRGELRRRVRDHARLAGAGLRRRGRRGLQEAGRLRRRRRQRLAAAGRDPGRRRVGVRHPAPDGVLGHRPAREPRGADPPGVPGRRGPGGDARRRRGVQLQQRHQGHHLRRRGRVRGPAGLRRRRLHQELHQGRLDLRVAACRC